MIKKIIRPLATFAISFALLLIPFALEGIFPFGNRQIMIIDSWHQYYPILQELHDKLINGKPLLYTWHSGGGTNFWLMMTYYAMSPLNLLSVFVSKLHLREFLFFITLFKISLGGAFFSVYLQAIHKRYDMSTTFFGMLYAFCGFFMAYYWNVMWLDVVAIFPLIILGLHRVIFTKKIVLYTLTLTYAIISNYYVAFFVCLFIALYSIVYTFAEAGLSFKNGIKRLLLLLLASLLAVGMGAVVLLPVIKGMSLAYGLSSHDPTGYETYTTLFDTINRLLPFVKPSVVDGPPNLALGIMGTLFFMLYFIQPQHGVKRKLGYGLLFAFLIFSTNINYLNFIWHGLHFPNQVPFRFAFTISFLMLTIAYQGYLALEQTRHQIFAKLFAGTALYLIIAEKLAAEQYFTNAVYGILLALLVYGAIFVLYFKKQVDRRLIAQLLVLAFVIEGLIMAGLAVSEAHSSGHDNYFADGPKVQHALDYWRANESDIGRIELSPLYTTNDPLLYQYRGISQFSSTANANYTTFTKLFGLSSNEPSNSYKYIPNTPIANGFLGINYIISKNEKLAPDNAIYDTVFEEDGLRLLKSRYPLPFGFAVKHSIYLDVLDDNSPFNRQQTWLEHASGQHEELFTAMPVSESTFDNIRLGNVSNTRYYYSNINPGQPGHAKLVFSALGDEQTYLYFKNQNKKVQLEYGGMVYNFDPRRGVIMDVGRLKDGAKITLSFDVDAQDSGYFDLQAVTFDTAAYQVAYDKLIQAPFNIEKFDEMSISGTIDLPQDGVLYTSIPYDGGWSVSVDGEPAKIMPLKKAVITVPLSAGRHDIDFSYYPPGLKQGLRVSLASFSLFVGLLILYGRFGQQPTTPLTKPSHDNAALDEEQAEVALAKAAALGCAPTVKDAQQSSKQASPSDRAAQQTTASSSASKETDT